jgi:hypothetical protein
MFIYICDFPYDVVVIKPDFAKLYRAIRKITNKAKEQSLSFGANVGNILAVGTYNPIRIGTNAVRQELSPYLTVHGDIEAKINHSVSYYMVNLESTA